MSIKHTVLIGYANGDVHRMQVMGAAQASQMAVEEAKEIGALTNAGFRTVVASAWFEDDTKSASLNYAAAWKENEIEITLRHGDRIASSHRLYSQERDGKLDTAGLLSFCQQLKIQ